MPVPSKNPAKEPKAAFTAFFQSPGFAISSPIKAPISGAKRIKTGPKNIAATSPIVAPQTALLLPPAFFVSHGCKTVSSTLTIIAIIPVTIITERGVNVSEQKYEANSPAQARVTPGKAGTTQPARPAINKNPARTANKIPESMTVILCYNSRHDNF